jgi:hypothetical protein
MRLKRFSLKIPIRNYDKVETEIKKFFLALASSNIYKINQMPLKLALVSTSSFHRPCSLGEEKELPRKGK